MCGVISKTDDNIKSLPMSKKSEVYKKQLEIQGLLVQRLGNRQVLTMSMFRCSKILKIGFLLKTYLMIQNSGTTAFPGLGAF